MDVTHGTPSTRLAEANQRLYALRAQQQVVVNGLLPMATHTGTATTLSSSALPAHLGWESAAVTAVLHRQQVTGGAREERLAHLMGTDSAQSSLAQQDDPLQDPNPQATDRKPQQDDWIKLYPDIGLGMLQRELTASGRLWLLLRHLDREGSGSLRIVSVANTLTHKPDKYHLCGKRQLRNLFRQGDGIFWQRDRERLWLRSTAKVAASLGVSRLTHRPVSLPVSALLGGVGDVKAHFYASFHSGRKSNPISRETLETMTGVPARTQRAYEERIGVQKQHNIAVGERYSETVVQERAWVQGTAVFDFVDHLGQQGPARRHYVAWHLPNRYDGPHQRSARGRMRKTNRKLKDLVTNQARGNSGGTVGRLFYADGAAAGRAYGRDTAVDRYWRRNPVRECPTDLWFVFVKEVSD